MLFLSVFAVLLLTMEQRFVSGDINSVVPYNTNATRIHVKEISTSSITLNWTIRDDDLAGNVTSWKVKYQLGEYEHFSEDLPLSLNHFTIRGLDVNTAYLICVALNLRTEYVNLLDAKEGEELIVCRDVRTIPYMRRDSIISMTLVLAAFAVIILSAVLTWRRAKANFIKFSRHNGNGYDDSVELKNIDQLEPLKRNCSIEERASP